MRRLDRSRDYAEMWGGRKLFAQDGHVFLPSGDELIEDDAAVADSPESAITEIGGGLLAPVETSPEPPDPILTSRGEPAKVDRNDMRLAVNRALKTQMEAFSERWQGVEHARKFLGIE
jgi:hypothetical protein